MDDAIAGSESAALSRCCRPRRYAGGFARVSLTTDAGLLVVRGLDAQWGLSADVGASRGQCSGRALRLARRVGGAAAAQRAVYANRLGIKGPPG